MDEMPSFEEMEATNAALLAAFDQANSVMKGMMQALASFEQTCINNGMSGHLSAVFTMRLAEGFGWPTVKS
jgi:hypothetical protein